MTITIGNGSSSFDWFTLLQSLGIIIGFLFSGFAIWKDSNATKLQNYILLTQSHREVWSMMMDNEKLGRVLERDIPAKKQELTYSERQFLIFIFLHITCSFELSKRDKIINIEKDKEDIADLLSYPLVRKYWDDKGKFYNEDFRSFIMSCISDHSAGPV
jgi:hypothetical protein